ncbi:O-antigen ligase family protein [Mesohalobacter salilacus]|uniref:O-antigen ligase family protein n=1 Tax=Mesohalobacter salilacus TaxID=2491711 RepID=UPI002686AC9D
MLLLLIILVFALIHGDFINELDFQKKFISGLFVFLLIKQVSKPKLIEYSFVFGVLTLIIYNSIYIAFKYAQGVSIDFSYGPSIFELLLIHRPYLAFLTVLANFIIFKWIRGGTSIKYYLIAIISVVFCFFITARLGMALHVLLIFHHVFKISKQIKIKHILLIFVVSTIVGIVVLKNPYLKERFRIQSDFETTYKKYKAYEIRFIIWDCSFETLKDHWTFGVQSHDNLIPKMTDCYVSKIEPGRTKKINYYKNEKFNTHNQFLDIWLIAGIPGLLILASLFVIPLLKPKQYQDMLTVLTLFFLFMMVENIFHRQLGCLLFGAIVGLYEPKSYKLPWFR